VDDYIERNLTLELMRMDIALKQKQAFWETPRNIAILVGTVSALLAAAAGAAGYKLGSQPTPAINIHLDGLQAAPHSS